MTHRAEQIIVAARGEIEAFAPSSIAVFAHRRLSVGIDNDELPAISVDFGEDVPVGDQGAYDLDGELQSLLTLNVTAVVTDVEEGALRSRLLELRAEIHRALRRNRGLSLPFVMDVLYGGSLAPDIDVSGETLIGELTSQWGVRYSMHNDTPE